MESALYTRDILRLAMLLVQDKRLEDPHATGIARSSTCGSIVEADIMTDQTGNISAASFVVNACAIGQASTAILQQNIVGLSNATIADLRDEVADFLKGEGDMPLLWPDLAKLKAAKNYPARHAAMLLPFDAIMKAMKEL